MRSWDPSAILLALYARASDDSDDTETSVTAQTRVGERWAAEQGITNITRYCDNDLSASHFATKVRGDFERLLADIAAGRVTMIWFWSLSRSQRRLDEYVRLRDLCRTKGVGWVIKRKVYDLQDAADLRALGNDAVNAEVFSLELSENVKLGIDMAVSQGLPHGPLPYGYRRVYDGRGRFEAQVPDDALREAVDADGESFWWSPAAIVVEIITRIADGDYIARIARGLNARGLPAPKGGPHWSRSSVRGIATNKAYVGVRVHAPEKGERTEAPGAWAPIAPDFAPVFWRAQTALGAAGRKTTKPGRAVHLASYIARCSCGEHVAAKWDHGSKAHPDGRRMYACVRRCCGIGADELDAFIQKVVDGYLARPDVAAAFAAARADDSVAAAHHQEAARLQEDVETWRRLSESGEADPVTAARTIKGLQERIEEEQAAAAAVSVPAAVRFDRIDWADVAAARTFLGAAAEITVSPVGKGRRHIPIGDRVGWRWLIGPDAV